MKLSVDTLSEPHSFMKTQRKFILQGAEYGYQKESGLIIAVFRLKAMI